MKIAATKTTARAPAKGVQKRKRAAAGSPAAVQESVQSLPVATPQTELPPSIVEPMAPVHHAGPTVALTSNCSVKDAISIRKSLCEFASAPDQVAIDGSAVERIDTAIVQLLVAFVRERLGSDRAVVWQSPSVALLDAARLLGVTDLLTLPRSAAAERAV